jgi:lysozyme family protein
MAFASAVAFVIDRLEGGDKIITDSGGLTRWGISQRAYEALDVAHLTREAAVQLYHRDYWRPVRADELPTGLDLQVFDTAVNQGPFQAAKMLQALLHVPADGVIGPQTVEAARRYRPASELRALYSELRERTYTDLARSYPKHVPSLYGWRLRTMRVADEAGARGARS